MVIRNFAPWVMRHQIVSIDPISYCAAQETLGSATALVLYSREKHVIINWWAFRVTYPLFFPWFFLPKWTMAKCFSPLDIIPLKRSSNATILCCFEIKGPLSFTNLYNTFCELWEGSLITPGLCNVDSVRFLPENGIFKNAERRDCNKLEMDMDKCKCTDNEKFCQHKSNSLGRT